jgi:hypothetical protein
VCYKVNFLKDSKPSGKITGFAHQYEYYWGTGFAHQERSTAVGVLLVKYGEYLGTQNWRVVRRYGTC